MLLETTHGVSNTMSQVPPTKNLNGPRITSYYLLHVTKILTKAFVERGVVSVKEKKRELRLLSKLANATW